jgi:small redox-active disulfide protein 2
MKKILVLGPGCAKCKQLAAVTEQAAKEAGIEYTLEKVTEIKDIMKFGVMMTPGLVVDGVVKVVGKVPSAEEIKKYLSTES